MFLNRLPSRQKIVKDFGGTYLKSFLLPPACFFLTWPMAIPSSTKGLHISLPVVAATCAPRVAAAAVVVAAVASVVDGHAHSHVVTAFGDAAAVVVAVDAAVASSFVVVVGWPKHNSLEIGKLLVL